MSAVVGIGDHLGRQLPVSLLVPVSVASVDTTQANPGPRRSRGSQATTRQSQAIPLHSIYPCGYCQDHVGWETPGICCGNCDIWFHANCVDIDSQEYSLLGHESQTWNCYRCNTNNDSRIYQSYNVDTHNSYAILSIFNNDDVYVNLSRPAPSSLLESTVSTQGPPRDRRVSKPRRDPVPQHPLGPALSLLSTVALVHIGFLILVLVVILVLCHPYLPVFLPLARRCTPRTVE